MLCVQFHLRPDTVLLGLPGGSAVKNLPAVQETRVQSLGWEDPLEEGLATRSSVLAQRIPKNKGAWRATFHRVTKHWNGLLQSSLRDFRLYFCARSWPPPGPPALGSSALNMTVPKEGPLLWAPWQRPE